MENNSQLYFTSIDIPLTGHLPDGQKARAVIERGTPAIKITDRDGSQAMLMDGATVPIKWDSPAFHILFTEE